MFIVAHNGARVWGGAERAVALLLAGLQQRGHRVLLLCNDAVVARPARALGLDAQILPLGGDVSVHHAARLARRLRDLRPDALLVGMFKKAWLAGLAGRMAQVPRIVVRIGLETDVPRNAKYRFAFRRLVDQVVVVAERLRPAYAALPGYGDGRLSVIPNAVHPPAPRFAGGVRTELGIPPGARCVGVRRAAGGRRSGWTGCWTRWRGCRTDVHCILAGDGPLRARAASGRRRRWGSRAACTFWGYRADVAEVLAALDVFVMTSDREGMSNAMLEALAAEVPVVSTPRQRHGRGAAAGGGGDRAGRGGGVRCGRGGGRILRACWTMRTGAHAMRAAAGLRARGEFGFPRVLDAWERVLAGGSGRSTGRGNECVGEMVGA